MTDPIDFTTAGFLAAEIKAAPSRGEYTYDEAYEALQILQRAVTSTAGLDVDSDPELLRIMNEQTERLIRGLQYPTGDCGACG